MAIGLSTVKTRRAPVEVKSPEHHAAIAAPLKPMADRERPWSASGLEGADLKKSVEKKPKENRQTRRERGLANDGFDSLWLEWTSFYSPSRPRNKIYAKIEKALEIESLIWDQLESLLALGKSFRDATASAIRRPAWYFQK